MLYEASPGIRRFFFASAALLAVVVALFAFSASAMAQTTIVVNPTAGCNDTPLAGEPYCTIQAAVTAAAPGDTITVAAGTYPEEVNVTKQVTILGAPLHASVLTGGFNLGSGATSVKIGGFTITGGLTVDGHAAILASSGSNHIFTNNILTGPGLPTTVNGIEASAGVNNLSITNNVISNWNSCIYLAPVDNAMVDHNTINGCGVALDLDGVTNSLFTHNLFAGTYGVATIELSSGAAASTGLNFAVNSFPSLATTPYISSTVIAAVTALHNWWGAAAAPVSTEVVSVGLVYVNPFLPVATNTVASGPGFEQTAMLYVVDTTVQFTTSPATAKPLDVQFRLASGSTPVYGLNVKLGALPTCLGTPTIDGQPATWGLYDGWAETPKGFSVYWPGGAGTLVGAIPTGAVATLHFADVGNCGEGFDPTVTFSFNSGTNAAGSDGISSVPLTTVSGNVTLNFNQAPTVVHLDRPTVPPVVSGWTGATFSTTDPDTANTFTYSLVTGAGNTNNATFTIVDNKLNVASGALAPGTYSIRVRSTDQGTLNKELAFTVTVGPKATLALSSISYGDVARMGSLGTLDIPVTYTPNTNVATELKYNVTYNALCLVLDSATNGPATNVGGVASFTVGSPAAATGEINRLHFKALNTCPDSNAGVSPATLAMSMTVALDLATVSFLESTLLLDMTEPTDSSVTVIDASSRGNCNADNNQNVNAADYVATVLEIFDGDAVSWLKAPTAGFDGSPFGCDSDQSRTIDVNDVVCTVKQSFGTSCQVGDFLPASVEAAELTVAKDPMVEAGKAVAVPLVLDAKGNQMGAMVFSIKLDPSKVALDMTDANDDGNPDAVQFSLGLNQTGLAMWDAADNALQVAIFGVVDPMPALNGTLATVTLQGVGNGAAGLAIEGAAAASDDGSSVTILARVGERQQKMFLPLLMNQ